MWMIFFWFEFCILLVLISVNRSLPAIWCALNKQTDPSMVIFIQRNSQCLSTFGNFEYLSISIENFKLIIKFHNFLLVNRNKESMSQIDTICWISQFAWYLFSAKNSLRWLLFWFLSEIRSKMLGKPDLKHMLTLSTFFYHTY